VAWASVFLLARARSARITPLLLLAAPFSGPAVCGQTLRLWPQAVVVNDEIRLKDICDVDPAAPARLADLLISASPPPGGAALINMSEVRKALVSAGVNLAQARLKGATECAVSRPTAGVPVGSDRHPVSAINDGDPRRVAHAPVVASPLVGGAPGAGGPDQRTRASDSTTSGRTLRDVVRDWLERQVARYGIQIELSFGRTATPALDLTEPDYQFTLRRRSGEPLGTLELDVDILHNGQKVQTVPLVVNVRAVRRAVVAHRPINQGAEIQPADIEETTVEVTKIAAVANVDAGTFLGHRAKRYLPIGTVLAEADVERAPLINRGQFVDVYARVGGVTIVTSAKATHPAGLGDTLVLHSGGRRDEQFSAVVTGPRRAEVRAARDESTVARGGE
jgi:flagella basal body P-ring formation protein FlgA